MKKSLLLVVFLISMVVDAQVLTAPTNFQDSIQTIVKLGQAKPNDADLNDMIDEFNKKVEAYNKEQATLPMNIRERRRLELEDFYEKIMQSYQYTYGEENAQSDNLPVSLVGRAYSGVVLTSNAEYDRKYNCTYTIIFCTKDKCMVKWKFALKGQKTPDNFNLAVAAEQLSGERDYRYVYHNGELTIIDDSGRMVLEDNGRKIKMIDDEALHGDIFLLDDDECKRLLNQLGYNETNSANIIDVNGIPHRDYNGNIVYSSLSQIENLLKDDVAGYYKIPGIFTDVQKKVFSQSDDYINIYLPRLKKEKEYLLEDEFEQLFKVNEGGGGNDVWRLKYDLNSRRFSFELWHNEPDRYQLSNEKIPFHVLLNTDGRDYGFCLTYPKSLVAAVNGRSRNGKMGQEQTLYTGVVPETEAAKFYPERKNSLLWRFKIEKVKNGRLYGKTTKLCIVEGEPNGKDWLTHEQLYRYIERKDQPRKIVVDLTNTLSATGNTFKSVKTK